jgi:hypothetical protein
MNIFLKTLASFIFFGLLCWLISPEDVPLRTKAIVYAHIHRAQRTEWRPAGKAMVQHIIPEYFGLGVGNALGTAEVMVDQKTFTSIHDGDRVRIIGKENLNGAWIPDTFSLTKTK